MRQRLIIILFAFVVLVGLGVGAAVLVDRSDTVKNVVEKVANVNTNNPVNTNTTTNTNTVVNTNTNQDRDAILFVAKVFTERYGSYSTDDGYAGLLAATTYGTNVLNDAIRKNVTTLKTLPGSRVSVTKALVTTIVNQTGMTAIVTVQAQRTETIGESKTETTPTLQMNLVKSGNDWKVNSATWRI